MSPFLPLFPFPADGGPAIAAGLFGCQGAVLRCGAKLGAAEKLSFGAAVPAESQALVAPRPFLSRCSSEPRGCLD